METPLVAVFMVTYNHENYISQAIESVLQQQITFPFKIFIGDDCSTDQTAAICLKYKEKNPEIIEVRFNKQNIGASNNAKQIYEACFSSGAKYIAMLEGDDYWTDPYKLQKQVDFLEANEDFSMCFHKVTFRYEDNPDKLFVSNTEQKEISTIEDLANGNFISTLSCVFRNNFKNYLPDFFLRCPIGDYPLHLINAQYGKIKYLDKNMAIYRVHKDGMWEVKSEIEKIKTLIYTIDQLIGNFDEKIDDLLSKNQVNHLLHLLELQEDYTIANEESFYVPKGLKYILNEQKILIREFENSSSYRIGNFIIKPFRYFKRILKWLK